MMPVSIVIASFGVDCGTWIIIFTIVFFLAFFLRCCYAFCTICYYWDDACFY